MPSLRGGLVAKGVLYARFMGQRLVIIIHQSDASILATFLARTKLFRYYNPHLLVHTHIKGESYMPTKCRDSDPPLGGSYMLVDTVSFECGFAKNTLSSKVGPAFQPILACGLQGIVLGVGDLLLAVGRLPTEIACSIRIQMKG
jgi:hypothetical protein